MQNLLLHSLHLLMSQSDFFECFGSRRDLPHDPHHSQKICQSWFPLIGEERKLFEGLRAS